MRDARPVKKIAGGRTSRTPTRTTTGVRRVGAVLYTQRITTNFPRATFSHDCGLPVFASING
jgi:hypothetical protein